MLLTFGDYNVRACRDARDFALYYLGRQYPDDNIFRRLPQRILVNADLRRNVWTQADECTIIAVVGREPWKSSCDIAQ